MSDEPDNLVLHPLRRMDAQLDAIRDTSPEQPVALPSAGQSLRIDRIDVRQERLDLAEIEP